MDRVKQILSLHIKDDVEAINMLLSANIDIGGDNPSISVKRFDKVAKEILEYLEKRAINKTSSK